MDRVEIAFGRTQTAADAAVGVNRRRSTAQAAGGFGFDLLFRQAQAQIVKCLRRDTGFLSRDLALGIVEAFQLCLVLDIIFFQFDELTAVAGQVQTVARVDKAVQGDSPFASAGNRINGKARSGEDIATDKDIRFSGLERQRIRFGGAVAVQFHLRPLQQLTPDHRLTDGKE